MKEPVEGDLCPNCRGGILEHDEEENTLVCNECGKVYEVSEETKQTLSHESI